MNISFIEDEDKDYIIAFFPNSYKFFKCKRIVKDIMNSYIEGKSLDFISEHFGISYDECKKIIDNINYNMQLKFDNSNLKSDPYVLDKLTINVTDKCNLKCKYCYEQIENPCSCGNNMSLETIDHIFKVILSKYNRINNIQFFGGEALLNLNAIEYICEKLEHLYNNNFILSKPALGIVSNGTTLSDKAVSVLKKYNIAITVSFDGFPNINDKLRVFKNDKGTSEIIINNLRKLRYDYKIPINFEVTYTGEHIKDNIKFIDIIKYLKKEFDLNSIHITPVLADKKDSFYLTDISEFEDSIDDLLNDSEIKIYTNKLNRMLFSLSKKVCSPFLCNAGINQLAVSTNGDIYPCFMIVGVNKYKMGNVYNDNTLKEDQFESMSDLLLKNKKCNNDKCKNCHLINLCSSCLGINYFDTKSAFIPSETNCTINKNMFKKILFNICDKQ